MDSPYVLTLAAVNVVAGLVMYHVEEMDTVQAISMVISMTVLQLACSTLLCYWRTDQCSFRDVLNSPALPILALVSWLIQPLRRLGSAVINYYVCTTRTMLLDVYQCHAIATYGLGLLALLTILALLGNAYWRSTHAYPPCPPPPAAQANNAKRPRRQDQPAQQPDRYPLRNRLRRQ